MGFLSDEHDEDHIYDEDDVDKDDGDDDDLSVDDGGDDDDGDGDAPLSQEQKSTFVSWRPQRDFGNFGTFLGGFNISNQFLFPPQSVPSGIPLPPELRPPSRPKTHSGVVNPSQGFFNLLVLVSLLLVKLMSLQGPFWDQSSFYFINLLIAVSTQAKLHSDQNLKANLR